MKEIRNIQLAPKQVSVPYSQKAHRRWLVHINLVLFAQPVHVHYRRNALYLSMEPTNQSSSSDVYYIYEVDKDVYVYHAAEPEDE